MDEERNMAFASDDYEALGASTKHAYYDGDRLPDVLRTYQRLVDTVAQVGLERQGLRVTGTSINKWLKARKQIGGESTDGIAILAGFPDEPWGDLLVVKTIPQTKVTAHAAENLVHELLIARILMNLRPLLPCFVVALAGFMCNSMDPADIADMAFCSGPDGQPQMPYIIYERVVSSTEDAGGPSTVSLASVRRTQDQRSVLVYLFEVMCSLGAAQHYYKFTHYDLHDNNVLLRSMKEIGSPQKLRFPTDTMTYVVDTVGQTDIPVIIDFGWSYAEFEDAHGERRISKSINMLSKIVNQFSAWHDVYRLIANFCENISFDVKEMGMFGPLYEWLAMHVFEHPEGDFPLFGQYWGSKWVDYSRQEQDPFQLYYGYFDNLDDKQAEYRIPLKDQIAVHSKTRVPLTPWTAAAEIHRIGSKYPGWPVTVQAAALPATPPKLYVPTFN